MKSERMADLQVSGIPSKKMVIFLDGVPVFLQGSWSSVGVSL